MAASGDILYIALKNEEHAREIHYRRAVSGNDDLQVRDYMPPQLHTRYMAIAIRAATKRKLDLRLKTQIRWGDTDTEIYIKEKGEQQHYKITDLLDFMGEEVLPDIDMSVKWAQRAEGLSRRKLTFRQEYTALPSLQRNKNGSQQSSSNLTRKHSSDTSGKVTKKQRQTDQDSDKVEEIAVVEDNEATEDMDDR